MCDRKYMFVTSLHLVQARMVKTGGPKKSTRKNKKKYFFCTLNNYIYPLF